MGDRGRKRSFDDELLDALRDMPGAQVDVPAPRRGDPMPDDAQIRQWQAQAPDLPVTDSTPRRARAAPTTAAELEQRSAFDSELNAALQDYQPPQQATQQAADDFSDIQDPVLREYAQRTLTPENTTHIQRVLNEPMYAARQFIGAGANIIGGGVGTAPAAGAAGRIAGAALGGGISGGGQAIAREQSAPEAMQTIGMGGLAGAAVQGIGELGKSALHGLGNFFRRQQLGLTQADYEEVIKQRGLEAAQKLGELPDQIGATNQFWPQTSAGLAKRAGAEKVAAGRSEGAALAAARGNVGVFDPNDQTLMELARLEMEASTNPSSKGAAMQQNYGALADRLQAQGPQTSTDPRSILALKRQYEEAAGYGKKFAGPAESMVAEANADAATAARNDLRGRMALAPPEVNQQFRQSAERYGQAATVESAAQQAAARELSGTNQGNPISGAVRSAWGLGSSFAGNMSRLGEGVTEGVTRGAAGAAVSGQTVAAMNGDGRGFEVPGAVRKLLQENPYELGQYGERLREAEESGNLAAVLFKLRETDQRFRTEIYPKLLRSTVVR